ncbi:MAG TPA: EamA family transporter [Gammaproteobacteria bacterium]|nr:EamA family transporter [Gammaproteobacteria bacterium]
MSLLAAYLIIIVIWSTTPLAIQWSSVDAGFLFGVTARMCIGLVACSLYLTVTGTKLPRSKQAIQSYLAAGLSVYCAMLATYWSAQYIPSGLISVIFGLSPLVTGICAARLLPNETFTFGRFLAACLGLFGLFIIFHQSEEHQQIHWYGIVGMLFAVTTYSLSSVLIKRIEFNASGLVITTGGLLFAVPAFCLTWWIFDGNTSIQIGPRTWASILYLGICGSVIGFTLYYHVLQRMSASRVALITLVTPVNALILGTSLNGETIGTRILIGTLLILCALAFYEWGDGVFRRLGLEQIQIKKRISKLALNNKDL